MSYYDSAIAVRPDAPCRSDISDEIRVLEHEPHEKPGDMTKNFQRNTSINRSSIDSTVSRQSFSMQPPSLLIPNQSDKLHEFSSLEEEEEEEAKQRFPNSLIDTPPDATLPVMSQQSLSPLPVSSHQQSLQSLKNTGTLSHDSHMTSQDRSYDSPTIPRDKIKMARANSPRQSEILTEKRKRELIKGDNIISNSPEIIRRDPPTADHRITSPEDDNFSSLNSDDSEWDENPQRHLHKNQRLPNYSNREVCSPSSDSSPGPSSLEEVKGRRPRIVQRMDTDPGELHTKILTGSGSITAAHARIIQQGLNFGNLGSEVKVSLVNLSPSFSHSSPPSNFPGTFKSALLPVIHYMHSI